MRTGDILKIMQGTQVPNSCGKNQYLSSSFHPRISVHINIFQIDFHMLKYSCCNLNPTDKNQSALSLLKTTKQKVATNKSLLVNYSQTQMQEREAKNTVLH